MFKWLRNDSNELRDTIKRLEAERSSVTQENMRLSLNAQQLSKEIAGLRSDLERIKTQVREQTDADLLLASMRIQADILRGDKPNATDLVEQRRLVDVRNQMASINVPYGMNAGLSGGLLQQLGMGMTRAW